MSNQCDKIEIDVELQNLPYSIDTNINLPQVKVGTDVEVGDKVVDKLHFDSDPQTQITENKTATENNATAIQNNAKAIADNTKAIQGKANQSDLTAEIKARESGDTNTLESANSFTTSQINALNEQLKVYGVSLAIIQDSTLYKYTFQLKNSEGVVLSEQTIDLPIESVVVGGSYNADTQSVVLTLQNGSTIEFPIGDIVQGLVSQTTFNQEVADRKQGDTNTLASAKSYTDTEVGKVDAKANANTDAISKINDELPNKADNTRVDAIEMSVKDIVAPLVTEDTQGSDIFIKDTPSEDLFINTLGNTEQDVSPNLFDMPNISKTSAGINFNSNNQVMTINGTSDSYPSVNFVSTITTNDTITMYFNKPRNSDQPYIYLRYKDGSKGYFYGGASELSSSFTPSKEVSSFDISVDRGAVIDNIEMRIQIEKGTQSTKWQPYTGQPSPDNPIEVKSVTSPSVKSRSKNLFDESKVTGCKNDNTFAIENGWIKVTRTLTALGTYLTGFSMYLKKGKYTISTTSKINALQTSKRVVLGLTSLGGYIVRQPIDLIENNVEKRVSYTFTINEEATYYLNLQPYGTANTGDYNEDAYFKDIAVYKNDASTNYIPYQSSTTTYSIKDINGVTHEMNGIGGVRDAIVFKDDKWWLEKKFERVTFDGREYWGYSYQTTSGSNRLIAKLLKQGKRGYSSIPQCLSNQYKAGSLNNGYFEKECIQIDTNYVLIWDNYYCPSDKRDEWKQHLAQTPMEVVYELATPEYYELDQAEVLKMYAKTFNGGTNFTISSEGATPIMDFTATILDCGQHEDVALKDASGNVVDVHTGSSSVWMSDKKKSLKDWASDTDNSLTAVETKATRAMQSVTQLASKVETNASNINKRVKGEWIWQAPNTVIELLRGTKRQVITRYGGYSDIVIQMDDKEPVNLKGSVKLEVSFTGGTISYANNNGGFLAYDISNKVVITFKNNYGFILILEE